MQNKQVTLTLTVEQTNVVLASLGKQPLETTLDAFVAIKTQAEQQMKEE
jgi:hypothetical protein